ncbi:hypothetical protein WM08_03965 [Burkholderia ubonensis]|nr:hypothetical protein WJ58_14615 [Burkholderia ubonensis]KVP16260.1 hypothetical protein WJ84_15005 [Burkholderia ubonensis]KVP76489.1 hypothetical protein WJ94_17680 [Burkholderia ubonensis]KWB59670.1 hypothetical protein WL37_24405 [Burkholderia ubonensis]KWI94647.1 hypothetical protein WM08_03965 [Burkholderia ubonensis]
MQTAFMKFVVVANLINAKIRGRHQLPDVFQFVPSHDRRVESVRLLIPKPRRFGSDDRNVVTLPNKFRHN